MDVGKRPVVVAVLGMHRSGTSAITRGLPVLGVELGGDLMEPSPENPKGYWENWIFVRINERLLSQLGMSWHSLRLVEEGFHLSDSLTVRRTEALEQIRAEFGDSELWGFKDPRTPRLLPFWQEVFAEFGAEDRYVLALRHPLSVARSLERRDGFSLEKGIQLWLLHTLPAVIHTTGRSRVVVDYDRLLAQPVPELNRLSGRLGLPVAASSELEAFEREFLDPNLRHTFHDPADQDRLGGSGEMAFALYSLLRRAAADDLDLDQDEVMAEVRTMWAAVMGQRSLYAHLDAMEESLLLKTEVEGQLRATVKEKNAGIAALTQTIEAINKPLVSVIVPVLGMGEMTLAMLQSLEENSGLPPERLETIIVDNDSPAAETQRLVERARNVILIRNQMNIGYGEACNLGAERATGRYLLFANNDLLLDRPGAIAAMLETMRAQPDAGCVGAVLIGRDGVVQEAGARLRENGAPIQMGRGMALTDLEQLSAPFEADYCSGAFLMVKAELFRQANGFDYRYAPAYYEDSDLCFAIRRLGYKTYVQPKAVVTHFQSVTSKRTMNTDLLSNQNRIKFLGKWGDQLAATAEPGALMLDPGQQVLLRTPFDIIPGGKERYALTLLGELAKTGASVDLAAKIPTSRFKLQQTLEALGLNLPSDLQIFDYDHVSRASVNITLSNHLLPDIANSGSAGVLVVPFPFEQRLSPQKMAEAVKRFDSYDVIIVYSQYAKAEVERKTADHALPRKPIMVISPPVARPVVLDKPPSKRNQICSVGRFYAGDHNKRQDVMIEAFRVLNLPGWELHLLGSVPRLPADEAYFSSLVERAKGLAIHFHRDASREELSEVLLSSKIVWHFAGFAAEKPEHLEPFGIGPAEAMAAGCVPELFNGGGLPEVAGPDFADWLWRTPAEVLLRTTQLAQMNEGDFAELSRLAVAQASGFGENVFRKMIRQLLPEGRQTTGG